MTKRFLFIFAAAIAILVTFVFPSQAAKKLYIGGSFALTGAYAEDVAAVLAGFEDYAKYVNETKRLAPWRKETWPKDITIEVLWRDDELKPAKALSIYDELKAKGMLVFRVSGSPQALALKDKLYEDRMMATSMATGPYLMKPKPGTILSYYPIYTDSLAAAADWFKDNWKETRKPRVAYLTADNPMGKSIEIPEMEAYLKKIGYEFVGRQYVPLVPTAPPTTQLMWLKENRVDLALGVMINPGSQPTIKEAVRLGMGPHLDYKITFAMATPSHLQVFLPAMGELGEGFVVAGGFPPWDDPSPGVKFLHELQSKYRPTKRVTHVMYMAGVLEAMIQVEAVRLAMELVPFEKLRPVDVLEKGAWRIKNLDTGGLTPTPLTYGPEKVEGIDAARVDQIRKGRIVNVGVYPLRHLF
ncbi:MAG: ABC transporter substrate-binding protein [Desulfobacterota bacterium]|nr:ABC transporter substrate-binding protein [Thermodesulfobacteriota bacterium]MDW8001306.1 ABC transporter substrate-binding protein [Deltaproteobacteria bacterium]